MGSRNFIPKTYFNPMFTIGWEKHLLRKNFSFLNIRTDNAGITCIGSVQPSEHSITYTYKVRLTIGKKPKVYAVSPKIEYREDIHMYKHDNSLCLYYPGDFSWTPSSHLYNTIIPWTHEWYLFYELFQIYGVWMHPSVSHNGLIKQE